MSSLPTLLARIARTWPPALVRHLAALLEEGHSASQIARGLVLPSARADVAELQTIWAGHPGMQGTALALALLAAIETQEAAENDAPELVWTGPHPGDALWRRTDAALLEVIQSARSSLWMVTYAVHGGQILTRALEGAAARGVAINFVCESKDTGKIRGDNIARVRTVLPAEAHIYEWPPEKRERGDNGEFGTLHAKIAVADTTLALLSSANLTDCALDFNIESGVLLRGESAAKIARQLTQLVERGIWKSVAPQ